MIPEVSLEVKLGMTGWAEVGEEVQSYLKREAEAQELLNLIVTVVVATIMKAGKLEVAILKETDILKETVEIKQEILPLREDMEKETVVTIEKELLCSTPPAAPILCHQCSQVLLGGQRRSEIKDQAHQFDIREGMTSLSVMKEERNEE
uniref:Zinc finger CCCH-type containing 13 n=1 Tax=Myotis myotis TaxID=51298 RepID=A0A7J7ZAE8_MYOMY|nr:zinc finger CCCH-type containing 13 [Myotis myotis]